VTPTEAVSETRSKRPSVGVIAGHAPEGECPSVAAICEALSERGFDARAIQLHASDDPLGLLRKAGVDSAFLTSRGSALGSGCLQGLLEVLEIPYTGSSVLTVALSEDRVKTKERLRYHNVPTLNCYELKSDELADLPQRQASTGFPVEVRTRGASGPARLAHNATELAEQVAVCTTDGRSAVVERVVAGTRYLVAILEGRVLGARALPGAGTTPQLTPTRMRGLMNIAEQAAEAIGCRGAVSVELLVTESLNEFVTDIDVVPSLEPESLFVQIAASAGFDLSELCVRLVRAARLELQAPNLASVTTLSVPSAEEPIRLAV
jgi:D-alanine-D-alanine ligase